MGRILLFAVVITVPRGAAGCGFEFDAATAVKYYRSDGWQLPGTADLKWSAPMSLMGEYPWGDVSGARAVPLRHEEDPYIVEFLSQVFTLDGARKQMRPVLARTAILRWEMNKRVFAYSYGLIPVEAHRVGRKWKMDAEAGCIFNATFIDESGDGVFRLLVPGALTTSLVPAWVKRPD